VDVWLNNPRRPLEASGTSGMKVSANGGLNLSVLDGWWCEGYRPDLGWAIGRGETYRDPLYQDEVESRAIYDLLEKEVVPEFYSRDKDGLPRVWIARMKACLANLLPVFETGRMVAEYAERFYFLGARLWADFSAPGDRRAQHLAAWRARLATRWAQVQVARVEAAEEGEISVGRHLRIRAHVDLGELAPEDVAVEIYHGPVDAENQITVGRRTPMALLPPESNGLSCFEGEIPCTSSGVHGFAVRVLPQSRELGPRFEPGLITWG
jgi:starch phosphorylase